MADYDSRAETWEHIHHVGGLVMQCAVDLQLRAFTHDLSKLTEPELSMFDEVTARLNSLEYGSPEYEACRKEMLETGWLKHHYEVNRHHPEHWPNGINDMSLLDLIEMLCDWIAATLRMQDGDIEKSIAINAERFGYGAEIEQLLRNTLRELVIES